MNEDELSFTSMYRKKCINKNHSKLYLINYF